MKSFIIIETLEKECFNDRAVEVYCNTEGEPIEFDSIEEAKKEGITSRIPKFSIYQKVSEDIDLPYDPVYED